MQERRLPRRIQIPLTEEMAKALYELAVREKRTTTDQTTILVRDRLIELGYLIQRLTDEAKEPMDNTKHSSEPAG